MKKVLLLFSSLSLGTIAQTGWIQVNGFGSNPASLNMYSYVAPGISGPAPLVVAMHGCTQNASMYASQTGWNILANRHKFYVIYPEQIAANNSSLCFNWFQPADQARNQGEALSIKQMVDYMKMHYAIDTNRIFVTGLSAGACMTNVMLACYPDVFAKGSVMSGAPYKSATNAAQANNVMFGLVTNTPAAWASLVTNVYPSYSGPYPGVAVFHGSNDNVVNIVNENEIMKQWTGVHQTHQTADVIVNSFNGNSFVTKNVYNDLNGNEVVETFTISGMGHAVALDTGSCYQECGATGTYAWEVYLSSTFWSAYFFNILLPPYSVNGPITVIVNQSGTSYSVNAVSGSTYTWTVPTGVSIVSGQGTNSITVNFGAQSGFITVEETQSNNCKNGPVKLFVTVTNSSAVQQLPSGKTDFISQTGTNTFIILSNENKNMPVQLFDITGRLVVDEVFETNKEAKFSTGINPGIYLVRIKNSEQISAKKFLVAQ